MNEYIAISLVIILAVGLFYIIANTLKSGDKGLKNFK